MISRLVSHWMRTLMSMDILPPQLTGRDFTSQSEVTTPRITQTKVPRADKQDSGLHLRFISLYTTLLPLRIRIQYPHKANMNCFNMKSTGLVLTCQKCGWVCVCVPSHANGLSAGSPDTATSFVLHVWNDCLNVSSVTRIIMGSWNKGIWTFKHLNGNNMRPKRSPSTFNHVCDVRNELVQLQSLVLTVSLLRVPADSWPSMPGILLPFNTFITSTHNTCTHFSGAGEKLPSAPC